VTDAEGHVTTTSYYPDGKVWRVIDANEDNAVTNRYYGDGSLKEVEDAQGNITQYEYNGFKALKKTTYEDETYEQPTYDQYRRVTQTRGRSGQVIYLTYDGLNRVKTKTVEDPNGLTTNTITYTYDLLGRLYRVADNSGTTKNTYDKAGRLVRAIHGVIHIGFLSTIKILSPDRNISPHEKRPRPIGFVLLSAVLPRDINVPKRPGSLALFRTCLFSLDSFVESTGPAPIALSCSHPSGSKPGPSPSENSRTRPHPDSSGPEQRQYRTRFNWGSLLSERSDTSVTDRVGPGRQTFLTPDAGERESEGPQSFCREQGAAAAVQSHLLV